MFTTPPTRPFARVSARAGGRGFVSFSRRCSSPRRSRCRLRARASRPSRRCRPRATCSLLGHIPGTAAGMVFKDNYAYVSGWGGITVLDISRARRSRAVAGALPLPHFENEDVDLCGNTLMVVNDRAEQDIGSVMYVVSIANPTTPMLSAVLPLGLTGSGRGPGHIANFVKADCSQAWVDGGELVEVVDLTIPTAPMSLGKFESAASLSDSLQGHARHRARQHRHAVVGRRRRRGGLQADRQSARAEAARHDGHGRPQPLALQRLHPPQLAAAREDAAGHRGGLHRHRARPRPAAAAARASSRPGTSRA